MADLCNDIKNFVSYAIPVLPAARSFKKAYEYSKAAEVARARGQSFDSENLNTYSKWASTKGSLQLLKGVGVVFLVAASILAAMHGMSPVTNGLYIAGGVALGLGIGLDWAGPSGFTHCTQMMDELVKKKGYDRG